MRKLDFMGIVRTNEGGFAKEMVLPGRDDLIVAPADWPTQLHPGTLNIEVNRFPEGFQEIGSGDGLNKLDDGKFRPELAIPHRKITGNSLRAEPDDPTRGMASIWRAELRVIATDQAWTCWMLRIMGSGITTEIELVAQEDLRSRLSLCDGAAVNVTVWESESKWKLPTPDEIIADWCAATRGVEENFGCEKAMGYLIGEKFLNFLEVAETNGNSRQTSPAFVTEIKSIFEPWQLAVFLNTPRRLGALGHASSEEGHRMLRASLEESEQIQEDARNLILLEWAKELLLETEE